MFQAIIKKEGTEVPSLYFAHSSYGGLRHAILHGLCSPGLLYSSKIKPMRYTRPFTQDLFALAGDMWKAFETYHSEEEFEIYHVHQETAAEEKPKHVE